VSEHDELPLPDYDHLPVASLHDRIRSLTAEELQTVLDYEQSHASRVAVLQILKARHDQLGKGQQPTSGGSGIRPEQPPPAAGGSPVQPATTGPKINPPSQGVPTNPAQPR